MPPRVLGLYALALMERTGAVHGYEVSQRIAERTRGAWSPGAGAVYPALAVLEARGLAVSAPRGRRREYQITASGRALLRRIRAPARGDEAELPDLSELWEEIAGRSAPGPFLLRRLRRTIDGLESVLDRAPADRADARSLRTEVIAELERARTRFRKPPRPSARRIPGASA